MDEAVFTTFRSLSLLGLVVFAFTNAVAKIVAYAGGTTPAPVRFEVIGVYTFVICLICAGLWFNHHRSWKKTGEASDILKLEARAAAFDGAITGCAGVGFGIVFLLQGTSLAFIAPVGDSIIVVVLCLVASGTYWSDFKSSMGEVLGVSASQDVVASVRRGVTEVVTKHDVDLVDVAVLKAGRTFSTAVYVNPKAAISGLQVDAISTEIRTVLLKQFKQAEVLVIVSESGRESFKPV